MYYHKRRRKRSGYAVEKVLDKRNNNGVIEYFLKWKNYPDSVNSWEPEHNLNCPDLIKEFEDSLRLERKYRKRKFSTRESDSEETSGRESEEESESEREENISTESDREADDASEREADEASEREADDASEQEVDDTSEREVKETSERVIEEESEREMEEESEREMEVESEREMEKASEKELEEEEEEFDPNLVPDEILGATTGPNGQLKFVIKCKKNGETGLLSSKVANNRIPQLVIGFYEQRIGWEPLNYEE